MAAGGIARLVATLDAALPGGDTPWPDVADEGEGLAAILALHGLLAANGLSWDDVLPQGGRLPKLCGRLGSTFPGERAAAYHHAALLVRDLATRWSALLQLPPALAAPAAPEPAPAAGFPPVPAYSAPDGDWPSTIAGLRSRAAWRSAAERRRLDALEALLHQGGDIGARDAIWLRDLWWFAELASHGEAAR